MLDICILILLLEYLYVHYKNKLIVSDVTHHR